MRKSDIKFGIVATEDGGYDFLLNGDELEVTSILLNATLRIPRLNHVLQRTMLTYYALLSTPEKVAETLTEMQKDKEIQKEAQALKEWTRRMEMLRAMEINANMGKVKS